jgi:hypothetical protein
MRASDLLGARVRTADGDTLGHVTDLRCRRDGPVRGHLREIRLEALVVSSRLAGSNLGYQQRARRGPWLIGAVMRRLHRDSRLVGWDLVDDVSPGEIRLREGARQA